MNTISGFNTSYQPHQTTMKYSSLSKRRSRGYSMDSIRLFAGSCIFIIVCGNLVMLQSYHSFVDNHSKRDAIRDISDNIPLTYKLHRNQRDVQRDIFHEYEAEFLPQIQNVGNFLQYSGMEGRLRKLMQENHNVKLKMNDIILNEKKSDGDDAMLTCADVDRLENFQFLGSGWNKAVYKADLDGRSVAVKTVDITGHTVRECVDQGFNMTDCYAKAAYKIIKEIVLLQALSDEHVIKVLGYCVPDKPFDGDVDTTVAMVTELGEPIDQIKLLQMSWEDRLRVSYDLTRLVDSLTHSPYGSVSLNDFQRNQFVRVNGTLKLSDVDDAGFGEPVCQHDKQCNLERTNFSKKIQCIDGQCKGYNEYMNIMNAGRHFTSFLLPHGAPKSLRPLLDKIVDDFENLTSNARGIVRDLDRVVSMYSSGTYMKRPKNNVKTDYQLHKGSDFPGQYDYRCRFSMNGGSCTLAVFDLQEATDVCDMDEECKGFVWSHRKTWTGRTLVHLKNGLGTLSFNGKTDLYIKPS